ncbi:Arm DNA-binding domain-containing protein [Robertmurraya sp. P23]|uniref:Arm DNA-binding domain-containing protein n=1 Tax=Robertmurraya sp. P23 TaxID=3436931 RepID=UPI003D96DA94
MTGKRKQLQKSFKTQKEAKEFTALVTIHSKEPMYPYLPMNPITQKQEHLQISFQGFARNWFEVDYYQQV